MRPRNRRLRKVGTAVFAAAVLAGTGIAGAQIAGDRGPNVDTAIATFDYERTSLRIRTCAGEDGGQYSSAQLRLEGTIEGGHQSDPDSLTGRLIIETHTVFQHAGDAANHGVTRGTAVIRDAVTGRAKAQGTIDAVLVPNPQGLEGLVSLHVNDDPQLPGNSSGELVANFVARQLSETRAVGELGGATDDLRNPAVVAEGACGSPNPSP